MQQQRINVYEMNYIVREVKHVIVFMLMETLYNSKYGSGTPYSKEIYI